MSFIDQLSRRRGLNRLIDQWVEYRDMVSRWSGQEGIPPEAERTFLELKASIAARLPLLQDGQGPGSISSEAQSQAKGMVELMNGQLALVGEGPASDFLNRWHAHYLYLHRFKGQDRHPARPRHVSGAPASMPGDNYYRGSWLYRTLRGLFDNWFTRFVVRLAVVAGLVILVARVLDIDLRHAPEWGRRVAAEWWGPAQPTSGGGPTGAVGQTRQAVGNATRAAEQKVEAGMRAAEGKAAEKPPAGTGRNVVTINGGQPQVKHSVNGTGVFQPPPTPAVIPKARAFFSQFVPRPVREFFHPVSERYGVELTVAMIGIAMLLIAYMIFGRAR